MSEPLPLEPPPENTFPFHSLSSDEVLKKVITRINEWAATRGYGVAKAGSKTFKGRNTVKKVRLRCSFGRKESEYQHGAQGGRSVSTRMTQCEFKAKLTLVDTESQPKAAWKVEIINPSHNHPACPTAASLPVHRTLSESDK